MAISPAEFVLFTALALVALGPYILVETNYRKTGIGVTIAGVVGTSGVGMVVFWRLVPTTFSGGLKTPSILALPIFALLLASIVGFTILRARHGSFFIAFRNVLLLCIAMWVVVRLLRPMLEISAVYTPQSSAAQPRSAVAVPAPQAPLRTASSTNPSVNDWRNLSPSPWAGPIGPIAAVELVGTFEQLPKPCVVKVTAPVENQNLGDTLRWILQYGAKCEIAENPIGSPNADEPQSSQIEPNTKSGLIIHWASDFSWGENVSHWFDTSAFNVSISHRLPPKSNPHLIWIDIGPGSPWRE